MAGNALEDLLSRAGTYAGSGTNHEGERFAGRLELRPIVGGGGLFVASSATGDDGTVHHEEAGILGATPDGGCALVTLNSTSPGLRAYQHRPRTAVDGAAVEGAEATHVFAAGDTNDRFAIRVEMSFDLWPDGEITQRWAWGLPGGRLEDRSAARMKRDDASSR